MGCLPSSEPTWYTGRRCEVGTCVEVGALDDDVIIRSSQAQDVTLTITRAEWQAFLEDAKEGLFDGV